MNSRLNTQQRQAVEAEGSILIVAGPGTGKTKTLTTRIAHLLQKGVPADHILALTFTNKAARDMNERLDAILPNQKTRPTITTFHALCHQILTDATGEKPALITEAERQHIIRNLKKAQTLKGTSVRDLSLQISQTKTRIEKSDEDHAIADLLKKYQEALSDRGLCDFDDLLVQTVQFFTQNPDKRPRYRYVLVDEFQDTNPLQYELLKRIDTQGSPFVIGDPNQSIYGFRGASSEIFTRFKKDWPSLSAINLMTNYRSVPQVVAVSNAIFPKAPQLQAHRQASGQVQVIQVLNEYSEAQWIIDTIEQKIGGSTMIAGHTYHNGDAQRTFQDFVVLYRTHHVSKVLKNKLDESGIPYQIAGEGSPYQKPEVVMIIAALRYLAGMEELPEKMLGLSATQAQTLLNPLKRNLTTQAVSHLATRVAELFQLDLSQVWLQQFLGSIVQFDAHDLPFYLKHIQTIAEQEFYDPSADAVSLLTVHAAKGLEFAHVFLIAAEDSILPHRRSNGNTNLDEERRLFYVAVTRARDHLDILHTKKRGGKPTTVSPFVGDIEASILPRRIDPNMAVQQERLRKRVIKRSQTSLF